MSAKKAAKKEAKPAAPATPKTLDELLKAENPYEQAVADNIRGRHDENLEAAIVANQRSIQDCLSYVAGMAKQKVKGASCVVMSADDVFGLAVHWFLDGNTPIETDAGAPVDPAAQPVKATPPPTPKKPKAKKAKKAKFAAVSVKIGEVVAVWPRIAKELKDEGKAMHNCIGNGLYLRRVADGFGAIVFLREASSPDTPWCDVELRVEKKKWIVAQCYTKHNNPAPDLAKAAAQKIAARFTRAFIKKGAKKSA